MLQRIFSFGDIEQVSILPNAKKCNSSFVVYLCAKSSNPHSLVKRLYVSYPIVHHKEFRIAVTVAMVGDP